MEALAKAAYKANVLNPDVHMQLVKNIDEVAERAGIPPRCIFQSAKDVLNKAELDMIIRYDDLENSGLGGVMLKGRQDVSIERRMQSMVALLTRNFIDARMMVLSDVLFAAGKGDTPDAQALFIPNFLISKKGGKTLAAHQSAALLSMLISRMQKGKLTFLYARSLKTLDDEYGESLAEHVRQNYLNASR